MKPKPKKPRGKQHDVRAVSLHRIAKDLFKQVGELAMKPHQFSESIVAVHAVAKAIEAEAKRAEKLR